MNDKTPEQTSPATTDSDASKKNTLPGKGKKHISRSERSPVSKAAVLSLLISLVTIAALGSAGWYGYQNIWPVISSGTLASQSWVEQQLASNSRTVEASVNNNIVEVRQEFQDVSGQSGRLIARMDNLDRRLNRLQGADRSDWKLAEAEYLMRLANQRLLTMHDIKSARTLLAQADELLVVVDEFGLFSVRQALAEDIAALRATSGIDITGAWIELNALSSRIDELPVVAETLTIKIQPAETVSAASNKASPEDSASEETKNTILGKVGSQLTHWSEDVSAGAKEIGKTFAGQFRIRENNINQTPALLSPKQEILLRQNLRLMLEQAQVALLQGRTDVYHASIIKTQQWLNKWFLNDSPEMLALQDTLSKLSNVSVEQPIPDISRSLTALKIYINEKVDQKLPVEKVKIGEEQS